MAKGARMTAALEIDGLTMRFGGLVAVDQLSFEVEEGAIHGLIGPNGAGKTTTFNAISGFYKPTAGEVRLRGQVISGHGMHEVARRGLVRTFQHSTLFAEMSVLENALVGTHRAFRPSLFAAIVGADRALRAKAEKRAMEALAFFDLADIADQRAGDLSHGHQRTLGMAIAYAARPDVMLLDEPFTGMNPEETGRMMAITERLRADGMTIVIVEHDMKAIMGLCDRITCMSFGRLLAEGVPDDIRRDPAVIQAYLGGASHAA
jgi:ABC-type branched-subunit amino acid transport system ATPase component